VGSRPNHRQRDEFLGLHVRLRILVILFVQLRFFVRGTSSPLLFIRRQLGRFVER
jgi:hypothetical protein